MAWLLPLLIATAGLQITILWWTDVPLGVPGEWTWPRIPLSGETLAGWGLAGACAVMYLVFVRAGGSRQGHCGRWESAAWTCGLVVAGFLWLLGVQAAVPGVAGLPKSHFVLYYPRSSGYFWQARYTSDTTAQFLADYERQMAEGDYLHIGTHPPGLTLGFRGLIALTRGAPELTRFLLWTQPDAVRESADEIRARTAATPNPYTPTDAASVWLAALLVQCAAAATVVPLNLLLRGAAERADAWYAAALWPLVPAVAVFVPKSDAMFPFLSMLVAWLWCSGWRRQSVWRCGLSGLALFGGFLLSLAFVPVLVLLVVWTVFDALQRAKSEDAAADRRRSLACVAAAAGLFVLPLVVFKAAWDVDLLRVWRWNLANHAQFYAHFHRSYWHWLLVNPLELCFAAGAPLATIAAVGVTRGCRSAARSPTTLPFLIVWTLLWLSGKNMGEAARLWLLLMPWLVLTIPASQFPVVSDASREGRVSPAQGRARWMVVASLQAVVCIATVTGVDGFHFGEVPAPVASIGDSTYRPAP
jgi:hypothetical protein